MIKLRKGISSVVAQVLIILLVVVGIASIWVVVKPTINTASEQIQGDCFSVGVQPVKCTLNLTSFAVNGPSVFLINNLSVSIKREVGNGALSAVALIFEGDAYDINLANTPDVRSVFQESTPTLEELETVEYRYSYFQTSALPTIIIEGPFANLIGAGLPYYEYLPKKVSVAAVVGDDNRICPIISEPITCNCVDETVSGGNVDYCAVFALP